MGLNVDYEQFKKESKLYENIDKLLKLDDGSVIGFDGLEPRIKPLFDKIHERYILNRAVVAYENVKEEKKSPTKEGMLKQRIKENNDYFMNLTEEDKKTFQGIFERADDNLGKSVEWQNYFMLYTDLQGIALHNKLNSYFLQAKEKKAQIKRFEDAKDDLKKAENKWPYDAAMTISSYQKAEQRENKYQEDIKKLENSRKEEAEGVRTLRKEVSDLESKIKKHPSKLEDIKREKRKLINTLARYNKLKTEAETEYAARLQEIDNDKKELENRKQAVRDAEKQYIDKENDLYDLVERFEDQNLKDNINARKNRDLIGDVRREIQKLKENPEIDLSQCIFGKEDGTVMDKYGVKNWIETYTSLKLESKELKAKHLAAQEQVSEEMESDVAENENSEKEEELELVEGETNYEKLLTDLDKMLDKVDDIYWDEVCNTAKSLTGEVAETYQKIEEELGNLDTVWDEKIEAVTEQKKKVDDAPAKVEEAKKTFDENIEVAYDEFNPNPKVGKGFFSNYFYAFQGDYKTFPEQVDKIIKEKVDRDIRSKEEEYPELEEKLKEAKTNYEQTRKDFLDGEEKYNQEWLALKNKKTEAGYDTEKYKRGYDQLKPASDNFAKVYKETFHKMPSQEHYDIEPLIKQQAAEWLKVEGLHSENHKNSIEYDRMIAAVKMVANYNTSLQHQDFDKFKGTVLPVSFEDTVTFMKEQAEKYQKAKDRQFRPFPSRMRTHRKNVAKFLIGFADNAKKGIAAEKEVKELDQYLLSEGKSRGLDLSQDRLIEKIKEDEHLEHPGEKEKLENTQVMQTENQKEIKEKEAPEMGDDSEFGMK